MYSKAVILFQQKKQQYHVFGWCLLYFALVFVAAETEEAAVAAMVEAVAAMAGNCDVCCTAEMLVVAAAA